MCSSSLTIKSQSNYGELIYALFALFIMFYPIHGLCQDKNDIKTLITEFPVNTLNELVQPIDGLEYKQLLKNGSSPHWTLSMDENNPISLKIASRQFPDNSLEFYGYQAPNNLWMFGVKQVNAQNQKTEIWLFNPDDKNKTSAWGVYPVPDFFIKDFVSEQVDTFLGRSNEALPYLNVEFDKTIFFRINAFYFSKDLESLYSIDMSGSIHSCIKYMYSLGSDLVFEKRIDEEYESLPAIAASVENEDSAGPGIAEFNCPHGVLVKVSSELPPQSGVSYSPGNLLDKNIKTSWSEGVVGSGIGEWIEFTLVDKFIIGESYQLCNGYVKDRRSWTNNNRVKKMKCFVNGKPMAYIILRDVMEFQSFSIHAPGFKHVFPLKKGDKIRFVIEEIYKGLKYDDTLLSLFVPTGNCG